MAPATSIDRLVANHECVIKTKTKIPFDPEKNDNPVLGNSELLDAEGIKSDQLVFGSFHREVSRSRFKILPQLCEDFIAFSLYKKTRYPV